MGRFKVKENTQFRDGKQLVANYLAGHAYGLTDRNKAFVDAQMAAGNIAMLDTSDDSIPEVSGSAETSASAAGKLAAKGAAARGK